QISGGVILASLIQVFIGCTGIIGTLLRFIGPLTIIPTLSLVALLMVSAATNVWSGANMYVFAGNPQSPNASAYVESQGRMSHENLRLVSVIRGTLTETCMVFQTAHRTCMPMVITIDIYGI
ncbi:hypothetical protein LSAT2_004024, partial [Lamellibrachia satsuma]